MEEKHTKGPWVIRRSLQGFPYQIDAPNGHKGPGGITSVTRWAAISFPSSPEGEANARLISAAPDLLEALERLHTVAEMTTFSDQFPAECEAARAALAKAEARS